MIYSMDEVERAVRESPDNPLSLDELREAMRECPPEPDPTEAEIAKYWEKYSDEAFYRQCGPSGIPPWQ